jgi:hypothetical protein
MLEALAQKADEAEWKLSMQRDASLQAGEPGIEWHEMRTYLRTRLDDATHVPRKSTPKPQ